MRRILIVGGSTRAAAGSVRRAGLQPICADLFADLDTRQIAEIVPVRQYPCSLPDDVSQVQADGWFYTGGLENHPDLIARLDHPDAPYGPLLGTSAASLRKIRDPFWWCRILSQSGIPTLSVLPGCADPQRDGSWVRKPVAGAGGVGVQVWDQSASDAGTRESYYFQARVAGLTHSAVFHHGDGGLEFLGMTQQLENGDQSHAFEAFQYCGSIGPLDEAVTEMFRGPMMVAAKTVVSHCGLRGIFGIDFIPDEAGRPWILEVNPRYTASVEVIELAVQRSLLLGMQRPHWNGASFVGAPMIAKRILYASESFQAPTFADGLEECSEWELPKVADIPVPGSRIEAAWPICTVMASGSTRESCLQVLRERTKDVREMLQ